MVQKSRIKSAQPESQAAVNHLHSTQSTSIPAGEPVPGTQHGGQGDSKGAAITKGECYGEVYPWAVDVSVPLNWTEKQDRAYALEILGVESEDELVNRIRTWIDNFYGVLTFAFCFLTKTPYEPEESLFGRLPLTAKLAILKTLIHQRSQDSGSLERFDCDLRRFVDIETICMPVLERYLLDPESVWLRELVDVHDAIITALTGLSESLACELEDCPRYVSVDRIDPPLRRIPAME